MGIGRNIKWDKNLAALILFFVFWFSLVMITGTLTSGFHLTDDHTIITLNKTIQDNGLLSSIKSTFNDNLKVRFAPFCFFTRVIITYLLGSNFLYWSIYHLILAIFTSYFLFLFIYIQGYRFLHALIFSFLTLIGTQTAIWWKLGTAETISIFLLSASLFFLASSITRNKKYQLIISFFFMLLASLSKESFVVFIPAFIILIIWLKQKRDPGAAISRIIIDNYLILISLSALFLLEIAYIIYFIGTNNMGYAGIDNSFNILSLIKYVYIYLRHNIYIYLILFGLFLLIQNIKTSDINFIKDKKRISPYIYNVAILLAIILPQFILYLKSGLYERYLLPLNLGFAFFIVFLLDKIYESAVINIFSKRVYVFLLILSAYSLLKNETLPNAKYFVKEGISTNEFLSKIINNSKIDDSILIVLNGYENIEWGFSIKQYLTFEANRKNINFYTVRAKLESDYAKGLDKKFSQDFRDIITNELSYRYSCIAILPFTTNTKIKNTLDSNFIYQRNDFYSFTLYAKKKEFE